MLGSYRCTYTQQHILFIGPTYAPALHRRQNVSCLRIDQRVPQCFWAIAGRHTVLPSLINAPTVLGDVSEFLPNTPRAL